MSPAEREQRQREARRLLSARRIRAGFLRRRVVVLSIVCFAILWTAVFVQMATGNDPVLSAKSGASPTAKAPKRERRSEPEPAEAEAAEIEPAEAEEEFLEPVEAEEESVEPVEEEFIEPEAVEEEAEFVEAEPEPELEPLTTGQS